MIALPTGDSFESFISAGSASAEPTMWYSTVLFAPMSRSRTFVPTETSPERISFFVTTRAFLSRSSSVRDARLEMGLVVLRGVVLRVLRDVAELARDADALRDLAAALGRQVFDLLPGASCSPPA